MDDCGWRWRCVAGEECAMGCETVFFGLGGKCGFAFIGLQRGVGGLRECEVGGKIIWDGTGWDCFAGGRCGCVLENGILAIDIRSGGFNDSGLVLRYTI